MKWLIASDIHGSSYFAEKLICAFEKEKADKMLLLGDFLYHGPRNDLPRDYDPKKVIDLLNKYSDKIVAVRGNCDSEVDQMVLEFPMMADYAIICDGGKTVFATHGHVFGKDNPPKLKKGDVLLCGHTHVSAQTECENFTYINPGSVSIPKENTPHGYLIFENGEFVHKEL